MAILKLNVQHLIHTIVLHDPGSLIICHQVIILIIPCKQPRTYLIISTILAQLHLLVDIPVKILIAHADILCDCLVDDIDTVIDIFIGSLVAVCHDHLTLQRCRIVPADLALQLFDQLP